MNIWAIKLERESEETFFGHMHQDEKPTDKEVYGWLLEENYIDDNPDHCRLEVWKVNND